MSGRGGRDRSRRDHLPSASSGRSNAPPSRHLWVGNLSHSILEPDLTDHFLQFGELESVAFQPGRSYAFINFMNEEDAFSAIKALQGFPVAGNPLRIEFAKAEKSSTPSRDEDYLKRRDEQRSKVRGSPFSPRESRARHASPEHFTPDKSKVNDRSADPSEVLWIGFPALLKVDEVILRKAFSPFGEIDKITVFPGRSYAFVRFRRLSSACRAKETLQGKLFGNPRVHICFAKSEGGSSNSGRGSVNAPNSPRFRSNGRLGSSENFLHDRSYADLTEDASIRSPFMPNYDSGDVDIYSFKRKGSSWSGGNTYDPWRFGEGDTDPRLPQDVYEHSKSPMRFHDFPPKLPQKNAFYEEPWDMPEDPYPVHGAKKLRTGSFPPEKELPEYSLSDLEQEKRAFPRILSDIPTEAFDKNFEPAALGYKQIPDRPINLAPTRGERNDHWKPSYDGFPGGSGSLQSNVIERKRFTPELDQPSLKEWKWEGTIAKGGTPVCRARCFPVGKVLDIMLPEFLDCTARTGLDMLAKHYYQASSAWVVFFVPGSDADIGFYNEFMHYLGEKQRAAVAKLDDMTTLFLVPPSDFSEKVLKVPGKLSISGVVLRLEPSGSTFGSGHPNERNDANSLPFHGDTSFAKLSTMSGSVPSMTFPELSRPAIKDISYLGNGATSAPPVSLSGSAHSAGNVSDLYNEHRRDHVHQQNTMFGPGWTSHEQQHPVSVARDNPLQVSGSAFDPAIQVHQSVMPRAVQETYSSNVGSSGIPLSGNSKPSMPINALEVERLAQLASSLIGQQIQVGNSPNVSMGENFRHTNTTDHHSDMRQSQGYVLQNNQATPELSTSQFPQLQQLQQQQQQLLASNSAAALSQATQRSQQLQGNAIPEDGDGDPQKRLQATLQLAAALLQQIQQGKGT